ncbi:MAG: hypothetical protein ACKOCC_00520 [Actinomycetota bacterium]
MSTRKLILTALVCGLAIMLAGGFKLLQVARDDVRAEVLAFGTPATLGDMTVAVESVAQEPGATVVTVTMSGVEGADAVEGWRLLVNGEVTGALQSDPPGYETTCATTRASTPVTCTIGFAPSEGSVTVAYLRAGTQSQWAP